MKLEEGIFIDFLSQDAELVYPSDWISFSLSDSIHSLYSKFSMTINDKEGGLSELLVLNLGNIIEIRFGYEHDPESVCSGHFILTEEMLPEKDESASVFGGNAEVFFLHEFFNIQKAKSNSYQENISDIIEKISNSYSFSNREIDLSRNFGSWYQGMRTDAKFIEEVLLPRSFSTQCNMTPYFCFIDNKEVFNFRHYQSMFEDEEFDYTFWPKSDQNFEKNDVSGLVMGISRWSESLVDLKKYHKINKYSINSLGDTQLKEIFNVDFKEPSPAENFVVSNQKDMESISYYLDFEEFEETDSFKAKNIQIMKESFFRDRFMILVPFNPNLSSGKSLNFNLFMPNEVNDTYSSRYSGRYLIENCEHIWDGPTRNCMTKLIISRKYAEIPDDYTLKGLL